MEENVTDYERQIEILLDTVDKTNKSEVFKKIEALQVESDENIKQKFIEILSIKIFYHPKRIPIYAELFKFRFGDMRSKLKLHVYSVFRELLNSRSQISKDDEFEQLGMYWNDVEKLENYVIFIKHLHIHGVLPRDTVESYTSCLIGPFLSINQESFVEKHVQLGLTLIKCIGEMDIKHECYFMINWMRDIEIRKRRLGRESRKMFEDLVELRRNGWKNETPKEKVIENLREDVKRYRDLLEITSKKAETYERVASKQIGRLEETIGNLREDVERYRDLLEITSKKAETYKIVAIKQIGRMRETIEQLKVDKIDIIDREVRRIHRKYRKMLRSGFEEIKDEILPKINKLLEINPDSIDILLMKVEVLKFERKREDLIEKIGKEFWKIERNPKISMAELEDEIDEFPSAQFMEKYEKLLVENHLKNC